MTDDIKTDINGKTVKGEVLEPGPAMPATFEEAEEVIERGLATFVEVGRALARIRDERWYREQGFENFAYYCRERWGMTRRYADYQIDAAHVGTIVLARGLPAPASEAVARELVGLKDSEDNLAATWDDILRSANGKRVTAALVKEHLKGKPDGTTGGKAERATRSKPRLIDQLGAWATRSPSSATF
jgi:hypothetical protein